MFRSVSCDYYKIFVAKMYFSPPSFFLILIVLVFVCWIVVVFCVISWLLVLNVKFFFYSAVSLIFTSSCYTSWRNVCFIVPDINSLHVLELIHTTFRVAFSDLAQCLVLVAALADVLAMNLIVGRLLCIVTWLSQVLFQCLKLGRKCSVIICMKRHFSSNGHLPSTDRVIFHFVRPKCVGPRLDLWCSHRCPNRVTHHRRLIHYRH